MSVSFVCVVALLAQDQTEPRHGGKTARDWIKELGRQDLGARRQAVYALWHLADPEAAVPLADALVSDDDYVRGTAAKALVKLGDGAHAALQKITELLGHERPAVRREAATLCYRLGGLAKQIVAPLTKALDSEDPVVRANAAAALGNAGEAASSALARVKALLDDRDKDVREWAAYAVTRIDPLVALKDERAFVRLSVLRALGDSWSRLSPEGIEVLLKLVRDETEEVRAGAANVLGTALLSRARLFPAGTTKTERVLLDAYPKEKSVAVRTWIAYALGRLPEISETTVPWLIESLEAPDAGLRIQSLSALRELGSRAKAAVPVILRVLDHPDRDTRGGAAFALGYLASPTSEVVDALARALEDGEARVRIHAAGALGMMKAVSALPALVRTLKEGPGEYTRERVASALGTMGPKAKDAVPALKKTLSGNDTVALASAYALVAIEDSPPAAAWDLLFAATLGDGQARRTAANNQLDRLEERAAPLVPRLATALEGGDPTRCERAARTLGWIGPAGASAIPPLKKLLDHPDPAVRDAASFALERIRKK